MDGVLNHNIMLHGYASMITLTRAPCHGVVPDELLKLSLVLKIGLLLQQDP